jgi:tetratricopeptide (TPR) repeat protein
VAQVHRAVFPDGQLFADMHGGDDAGRTLPADVLAGFLRSFGVAPAQLPDTLDERAALFRSVTAGRRILIVLDDAATAGQVWPLLPGHGGAAVIITGRRAFPELHPQLSMHCDILSTDASVALLGKLIGSHRLAAEPDAGAEIADLCGGMPLALRIAGARLVARRSWPLSVLAERLRDEHRRLDELVVGNLEVRASLALMYHALPDHVQSAFCAVGVLAPLEFSPWLLAALDDVPLPAAESLAEQLADAHLVESANCSADGTVRYRMHDLVRLYARERGADELSIVVQRKAMQRVMTQLLSLIRAARGDGRASIAVAAGESWFDQERPTLVAAVELASLLGLHELACQVSAALLTFYQRQNTFDDWWRTHDAALAAARAAGDQRGEATLLCGLGRLRYEQDRLPEALRYYRRALDIYCRHDDLTGSAEALLGSATIDREQCRFDEALTGLRRARALFDRVHDLAGMAHCDYGIGYIHRERGDFSFALTDLDRALQTYRTVGDRRGEGLTLRSVSLVHRAAGDYADAESWARRAVDVLHEIGDRLLMAYGIQALAKVWIRTNRYAEAADALRDAEIVCREYGDRFGCALLLRTLGELHLAEGHLAAADRLLRDSLSLWLQLGLIVFEARVKRDLAVLALRQGDAHLAARLRAEAVDTFRRAGTREYDELLAAPAKDGSEVDTGSLQRR